MIKNKFKLLLIILFSISLYSCGTVKEAVGAKKRSEQSDEFLVEKKNPLALPPDYDILPVPGNKETSNTVTEQSTDIKEIINLNKTDEIETDPSSPSNLEDSILEKIQ